MGQESDRPCGFCKDASCIATTDYYGMTGIWQTGTSCGICGPWADTQQAALKGFDGIIPESRIRELVDMWDARINEYARLGCADAASEVEKCQGELRAMLKEGA